MIRRKVLSSKRNLFRSLPWSIGGSPSCSSIALRSAMARILRRHLRGRLDALYFHLYGLDKDDAAYVLDTFPIVRRHDETQFGRYRTRDLVLAYMDALSAGDTLSDMAV